MRRLFYWWRSTPSRLCDAAAVPTWGVLGARVWVIETCRSRRRPSRRCGSWGWVAAVCRPAHCPARSSIAAPWSADCGRGWVRRLVAPLSRRSRRRGWRAGRWRGGWGCRAGWCRSSGARAAGRHTPGLAFAFVRVRWRARGVRRALLRRNRRGLGRGRTGGAAGSGPRFARRQAPLAYPTNLIVRA